MTGSSDIENDYLFLDNLKVVSITTKRKSGDKTDSSVKTVDLDISIARKSFGGINLNGDERSFIVFSPELINVESILPGDTKTDLDGTVWRITHVRKVRWETQYICISVKNR